MDAEAEDAFIPSSATTDWIMVVVAGANDGGVSSICPSITTGREIGRNGTRAIATHTP